ncbi:unnamed protein product [Allacma fusca]|uniref:Uncharacterized protein n=1 Tax=Allacma fusca TaxID=39272 RepID=A0A8J2KYU6_9HEXA|nr:unnamed protein product [Allacma fusca]
MAEHKYLKSMSKQLEDFGLDKFITIHLRYFINSIINEEVFGYDLENAAVISLQSCFLNRNPPKDLKDTSRNNKRPNSKTENMEFISKQVAAKGDCFAFLVALKNSNNDQLLNYINEKLGSHFLGTTPSGVSFFGSKIGNIGQSVSLSLELNLPTTDLGKSVASRLENVIQSMETRNVELPLLRFFNSYLLEVYESTGNVEAFVEELERLKVLSKYKAAHIRRSSESDIQRCEKIYETVFVRRDSQKLILAWETTGNFRMIQLTDKWLADYAS